MGRKRLYNFFSLFTAFGAIIAILLFMVTVGVDFNLDIQDDFIPMIPSLVLIVSGIFGIADTRGSMVMGGFMVLGVGFAVMTGQLNTMGILIPDLITPSLTLQNIKLLLIVFSGIIGAVFSTR